jgi:hypothetical protein
MICYVAHNNPTRYSSVGVGCLKPLREGQQRFKFLQDSSRKNPVFKLSRLDACGCNIQKLSELTLEKPLLLAGFSDLGILH